MLQLVRGHSTARPERLIAGRTNPTHRTFAGPKCLVAIAPGLATWCTLLGNRSPLLLLSLLLSLQVLQPRAAISMCSQGIAVAAVRHVQQHNSYSSPHHHASQWQYQPVLTAVLSVVSSQKSQKTTQLDLIVGSAMMRLQQLLAGRLEDSAAVPPSKPTLTKTSRLTTNNRQRNGYTSYNVYVQL